MRRDFFTFLLYARQWPVIGRFAYVLLKFLGVEVPLSVSLGSNCLLVHGGFGVVIHPKTTIGSQVKIYPGVTVGRTDIYRPIEESRFKGIVIEDDVILSPGAKILCSEGVLLVRRGAVIGANAVLLQSVGENEIWAGVPAQQVGTRKPPESVA